MKTYSQPEKPTVIADKGGHLNYRCQDDGVYGIPAIKLGTSHAAGNQLD